MPAYRRDGGHILLQVRVTPRASRDEIDRVVGTAEGSMSLAVRVRAVPDKGEANRAVIQTISRALEVPKSAIAIAAGTQARQKTIRIAGDPAVITEKIDTLIERIGS